MEGPIGGPYWKALLEGPVGVPYGGLYAGPHWRALLEGPAGDDICICISASASGKIRYPATILQRDTMSTSKFWQKTHRSRIFGFLSIFIDFCIIFGAQMTSIWAPYSTWAQTWYFVKVLQYFFRLRSQSGTRSFDPTPVPNKSCCNKDCCYVQYLLAI